MLLFLVIILQFACYYYVFDVFPILFLLWSLFFRYCLAIFKQKYNYYFSCYFFVIVMCFVCFLLFLVIFVMSLLVFCYFLVWVWLCLAGFFFSSCYLLASCLLFLAIFLLFLVISVIFLPCACFVLALFLGIFNLTKIIS